MDFFKIMLIKIKELNLKRGIYLGTKDQTGKVPGEVPGR